MEEEEQPLPPPKEVEVVSSPSLSDWSSLDDDSERNLEDATTETSKDSPHLELWEEAECKTEEEMLEEKEALLESFAIACKEERTREAVAQAANPESSLRGHGLVPACPKFPVGKFAEVVCIWKAVLDGV
jgi:hypothetical protein